MTAIALPEGTITLFKDACHRAVIAVGGRAKAAALLGVDESFLSKACRDNYPELLSRDHMLLLGVSGAGEAIASFFASFSHCQVVPFDDFGAAESEDLISDIGAIAKEQSDVTASLIEAVKKGTPAAARDAMKEIADVDQALGTTMRHLAVVASRGR